MMFEGRGAGGATAVLVRKMVEADIEGVMQIARELEQVARWSREAYVAGLGCVGEGVGEEGVGDGVFAVKRVALVAVSEPAAGSGEIQGFCLGTVLPPVAELESIGVSALLHGRGIGRALFEQWQVEAGAAGATEVVLEVRESNEAGRRFYDAAGFVLAGRRPGYYSAPVDAAILMRMGLE